MVNMNTEEGVSTKRFRKRLVFSGANSTARLRFRFIVAYCHSTRIKTRPPIMNQTSALSTSPMTSASSGSKKSAKKSVR